MASTVRNWFSLSSIKDWFSNLNPLKTKALPQQDDYLTKTLGKYEPYVFYLQNILIWDDPIISSFSILTVNVLFWIVFNFELKFYGVIFTTLLAWTCYEAWVDHIWPEISVPSEQTTEPAVYSPQHPSGVLSVPEISSYMTQTGKLVKRYCLRLRKMRVDQPGMFCCEVGSMCAGLTMLGRAVSGPCLVYALLMTAMVAPGVWIHVLPPNVKLRMVETVAYLKDNSREAGSVELDDLIPESTHENLQLFHLACQADDGSDKDDSSEFAIDPDSTDWSLSSPRQVDDISELEARLAERLETASDSSGDGDGIRFRGSHFDGSSEEDEEAFARGLKFEQADKQALQAQQSAATAGAAAALLGNLGSLLASAMTMAKPTNPPIRRRSSSSDLDDFEIIDPSEEKFS